MTTRYRCLDQYCDRTFFIPAKEKTYTLNLEHQKEIVEIPRCPYCNNKDFTEEEAPEITSVIQCLTSEADNYIKEGYHVLPEKIFENTVVLVKYEAEPEPEDQPGAECSTDSNPKQNNKNNKNQNPNQTSNSNSPAVNQFELWNGRLTPMEVEQT